MHKKVTLLSLAIPIFFEMILFSALGLVDLFMLSRVADQAAGAVGVSNQIITFVNIVFNIVSAGAGILISQFIGAQKPKEIHKTIIVSYMVLSVIGAICSICLVVFGKFVLIKMGVTPGLMVHAQTFLTIVGGFMFVQAFLNISTVSMRTHGYTKESFYITAGMNILNIVGDYLLIFGAFGLPTLGVKGVAISTTISRSIAMVAAIIFVFKKVVPVSALKYIKEFPVHIFKKLIKVGLPSALENMSYNVSQIVLSSIILINLGEEMSIVRTYVWSIFSLAFIFSIAIGQSNQMLVGRLIGQEKFDDAYKECLKNFKLAFFIAIGIGSIFYFFGNHLIGLFTKEQVILQWGATILMIDAFLEPGRTFNIVIISGLRGAGDVIFPVIMGVIFMWGLAVCGGYFFGVVLGWGLPGIWLGLLLDEWIRGVIMFFRWRSKKWTTKSLVKAVNT